MDATCVHVSSGPSAHHCRGRGFTLAEVLVIIAIICLLLAMLLPSLSRAREHAYDAQCRSNLHQLWTVLHSGVGLAVPSAGGWVGFVEGRGARGALKCPKDRPQAASPGPFEMGGNVVQIDPPRSVVFNDGLESNTLIRVFAEKERFSLPCDVPVNISAAGRYSSEYNSSGTTIPAGTVVDCHFIFFDPVDSADAISSGFISFGGEILGLIVLDSYLDATDHVLGAEGTRYATGLPSRGLEESTDDISLEADMRTVAIRRFHSNFPGENVRVLTHPGGATSYGMNNQLGKAPGPGQLMLLDYAKSLADVDGIAPDDDFDKRLAPRHLGRANAVFVDGSVRSLRPGELDPQQQPHIWRP